MDRLIDAKELSKRISVKLPTVYVWANRGQGPPFIKLGDGKKSAITWRESAVEKWIKQREEKTERLLK